MIASKALEVVASGVVTGAFGAGGGTDDVFLLAISSESWLTALPRLVTAVVISSESLFVGVDEGAALSVEVESASLLASELALETELAMDSRLDFMSDKRDSSVLEAPLSAELELVSEPESVLVALSLPVLVSVLLDSVESGVEEPFMASARSAATAFVESPVLVSEVSVDDVSVESVLVSDLVTTVVAGLNCLTSSATSGETASPIRFVLVVFFVCVTPSRVFDDSLVTDSVEGSYR
jgi:hypothetical protein